MDIDGSVSTSLQAAYILHYREWQETSFIVDAFTLTHGRIALIAQSARASKPRTRALYQPFRPLLLSWVGASEIRTLTGIEESGVALSMEDAPLACAYYINELILRLLGKDQPHPTIFAHYSLALENLATHSEYLQEILRTFELQLLDALGVLPNFSCCTADGSDIVPEHQYRYHPANAIAVITTPQVDDLGAYGGIQKEKHRMGAGDSRNPNLHADGVTLDEGVLVHGSTLIAMSNLEFDDNKVLEEAKHLMRHILRVHLGDRPLRSRELFDSLVKRE